MKKTYGEYVTHVTVGKSQKGKYNVLEKLAGQKEIERTLWIVSAPFCAMRYTSDSRYVRRDTILKTEWLKK